jgi:hypothetical protein
MITEYKDYIDKWDIIFKIIELYNIPEIAKKLNSEEFELFTNANKYNL